MPRKKIPCPNCGAPMQALSKLCRKCTPRRTWTDEQKAKLSRTITGSHHYWPSASTDPQVAEKIRAWWTPEQRERKRQEMLRRNPNSTYHGLSAKSRKKLRKAVGHCELCGGNGVDSRLDVHHRNSEKRDQSLDNLVVLCHRCHMRVHAEAGETGWDAYWRRRKMTQDL